MTAAPFLTKPGKHGTLHGYRIHYRDRYDDCCPVFTWFTWAYSAEHAEDKFFDSDDDGWTIVKTERVRDKR